MLSSRIAVALLAPAGVVAGHALAYSAAHGWEHERQAMLSGHGPFPMFAAVALPLALVGLLLVAAPVRGPSRVRLAPLAAAQVGLVASVEFVERVIGVEPLAQVLHDPTVWVGIAAQLLTATVLLLLVRAVERVRPQHPVLAICVPVSAGRLWEPTRADVPTDRRWLRSVRRRGPPSGQPLVVRG